jgi:hypothetical protein
MFTSQREDPHIIALVELDMQKLRVRFVLAREAIREQMRELEHPQGPSRGTAGHRDAPDNWGLEKMNQEQRTS